VGVVGIDNDQECEFMGNRIPLPHRSRSGVGADRLDMRCLVGSNGHGWKCVRRCRVYLANSSSLLAGVALGFSEASHRVSANPGKLR